MLFRSNKSSVQTSGFDSRVITISDGKKTWTTRNKAGVGWVGDTPKNDNAVLAGAIARGGFISWFPMNTFQDKPRRLPAELDDVIAANFSFGKKEKIGERQAQRIDYKLTTNFADDRSKKLKETFAAQVWLDNETNLPVKRVITVQEGDEKTQLTETYDIRINAKIDAKEFELPK